MENQDSNKSEKSDTKEISIIVAIGVIVIACICCLLIVAGYYLYNDINPTSTKSPELSPEITLAPTQSSSKVTPFIDEFNSNANEWNEGIIKDDYGTATYTINGKYVWDVVAEKAVNQKSWGMQAPSVENFTVSVDATHVSGTENASYGIVFRVTDTNNLYYFCISDSGYYYVGLLKDGTWSTLIDWKETSSIKVNSINKLKVKGEGSEFTLYLNGKEIDKINDQTLTKGTAGLAIELYKPGDKSNFEFDNFRLETP